MLYTNYATLTPFKLTDNFYVGQKIVRIVGSFLNISKGEIATINTILESSGNEYIRLDGYGEIKFDIQYFAPLPEEEFKPTKRTSNPLVEKYKKKAQEMHQSLHSTYA